MQPRGGDGRWIPTGQRLAAAAARTGTSEAYHVAFASVRRPAELQKLVGIDVKGFKHSASNQAMKHALDRHGVGGPAAGKKPLTKADFAKLPQIINLARYEPATPRKFGPPRVQLVAELDGDRYTYIGEVRRGKRRIDMISMWRD